MLVQGDPGGHAGQQPRQPSLCARRAAIEPNLSSCGTHSRSPGVPTRSVSNRWKLWHRPCREGSVEGRHVSDWLGIRYSDLRSAYSAAGFAQKAPDLRRLAGKEWLTIGGDWHNTRYSTLTQINRNDVKKLEGAWVTHLGSGLGQKYSFEGTPIVKDGILYIATGNDDVFALDGKTGALIWEHRSGIEQNISTVVHTPSRSVPAPSPRYIK